MVRFKVLTTDTGARGTGVYPSGTTAPLPIGRPSTADPSSVTRLLPNDELAVWTQSGPFTPNSPVSLYRAKPDYVQRYQASPVNWTDLYGPGVDSSAKLSQIADYAANGWEKVGVLDPTTGIGKYNDGTSVPIAGLDLNSFNSNYLYGTGSVGRSGGGLLDTVFRTVVPAVIVGAGTAGLGIPAAAVASAAMSAASQASTLEGKINPAFVAAAGAAPVAASYVGSALSRALPPSVVPTVSSGLTGAGINAAAQGLGTGRVDPTGVVAGGVGGAAGALAAQAIGAAFQPPTSISTPTPLGTLPPPPGLSGTPGSTALSPTPSTPGINPGVTDLNLGIFGGVPTPTPLTTSFINPGVAGINPGIFGTAPSTGVNMPFNFNLDFNNLFGPSTSPINPNVPDLNPGIFGTTPTPPPVTSLINPGVPDLNLGIFGGGGGAQAATGTGGGVSNTVLNLLKSFGSSAAGTLGNIGTRLLFGRPGTGGTPGSVGSTPGLLENILTGGLGIAGTNALGNFLGLNRTQQPQQTYSTSGQAGFAQFPDLQSQLASLGLGATQAATGAITGNLNAPINFPGLQDNGLFPQQQQAASQLLGPFANRLNAPINFPQLQGNGLFPQQQAAVDQLSRQMFSRVSGDMAQQGFLSPQNAPAVAGSAIQNMLPTLLPMISQNIQEAATTPEQIAQARLGQFGNVASMFPGLAGQNVQTAATLPEQIRQQRIAQLLSYMASTQGALGERRAAVGQGNFESFLAAINQGFGRSAGSALGAGGGKGLV